MSSDDSAADWRRVWEPAAEITTLGVPKRVVESSPGSLGCKLPEELATGVWFLLVFAEGFGVVRLDDVTGNARTGFGRSAESLFERSWFCEQNVRKVVANYWKTSLMATVVKLKTGNECSSHCVQRKNTRAKGVPKCLLVKLIDLELFVILWNCAENLLILKCLLTMLICDLQVIKMVKKGSAVFYWML